MQRQPESHTTLEHALKTVQTESELSGARAATSRAHTMLRNVAIELEEGRDPAWVADNIHEALGNGRPNKTGENDDA